MNYVIKNGYYLLRHQGKDFAILLTDDSSSFPVIRTYTAESVENFECWNYFLIILIMGMVIGIPFFDLFDLVISKEFLLFLALSAICFCCDYLHFRVGSRKREIWRLHQANFQREQQILGVRNEIERLTLHMSPLSQGVLSQKDIVRKVNRYDREASTKLLFALEAKLINLSFDETQAKKNLKASRLERREELNRQLLDDFELELPGPLPVLDITQSPYQDWLAEYNKWSI